MICPLLELVNHEVISLPFITNLKGISTPNYPPRNRELTHCYSNKSSLNRFFQYGFFSKESIIFSFPFSITFKGSGINLICKGKELNNDSIPIERSSKKIVIEGLPIIDVNIPNLPNYYFEQISRKLSDIDMPKNILLRILEFNISIRKNILQELLKNENEFSTQFIKLINHEINLISDHN